MTCPNSAGMYMQLTALRHVNAIHADYAPHPMLAPERVALGGLVLGCILHARQVSECGLS